MKRNRVNLILMQALMYSMFDGAGKPIGKRIEYEPINVKGMSAKEIGTAGNKKQSRAKRKSK